jgi:hypothetical protein
VTPTVEELVPGQAYEFHYVRQSGNGQWYRWTMTAVYFTRNANGFGPDELVLSGRPEFGTTKLSVDSVAEIRSAAPGVRARRPERRPGAVDPQWAYDEKAKRWALTSAPRRP